MKKEFTLALFLLGALVFILIGLTASQFSDAAVVPEKTCSLTMNEIIVSGQGSVYNMEGATEYEEPDFAYLVAYMVNGDEISAPDFFEDVPPEMQDEQKDSALQEEAWRSFADLIPPQNRDMVVMFRVFTDGVDNTLAAVEQNPEDITQWILDVDLADVENRDLLLSTLVHEYGHVLTLNATQVEPDQEVVEHWNDHEFLQQKAAACPNYFTGTGCSYPNSYMQAFYNRFWVDINDEWAQVDALQYDAEDLLPYYNALYQFYLARQDEFVDDYAATHPTEDIAESFTYFVFTPKPAGDSLRDQKIKFFYEYPELAQLREAILNGVCSSGE